MDPQMGNPLQVDIIKEVYVSATEGVVQLVMLVSLYFAQLPIF
jgi:hypothetical protein